MRMRDEGDVLSGVACRRIEIYAPPRLMIYREARATVGTCKWKENHAESVERLMVMRIIYI